MWRDTQEYLKTLQPTQKNVFALFLSVSGVIAIHRNYSIRLEFITNFYELRKLDSFYCKLPKKQVYRDTERISQYTMIYKGKFFTMSFNMVIVHTI